jgi:hypothetical protein
MSLLETGWKEIPFELQIKNLSEIPYVGRIEEGTGVVSLKSIPGLTFRVPASKQKTLKAVFHPRAVRLSVLMTYTFLFLNQWRQPLV